MVCIDLSTTLAEAVDACPPLAREFERRGLDYCCGGQRTIGDACTSIGLDPEAVIAELSRVDAATDGAPRVPGDLEDHERDQKADDRIADLPAEADERRARDDAEGDESVHAGMFAVGDEGGTA